MPNTTFRFPRAERLKSRKLLGELITGDQLSFIYPFRIAWQTSDQEGGYPLQVAFSVPKRRFRLAVGRNPVRRRMLEAWRLHHQPLIDHLREQHKACALVLIYSGKPEDRTWEVIERSIKRVVRGLIKGDLPPGKPAPPGRSR